jgi:hypothetical protein
VWHQNSEPAPPTRKLHPSQVTTPHPTPLKQHPLHPVTQDNSPWIQNIGTHQTPVCVPHPVAGILLSAACCRCCQILLSDKNCTCQETQVNQTTKPCRPKGCQQDIGDPASSNPQDPELTGRMCVCHILWQGFCCRLPAVIPLKASLWRQELYWPGNTQGTQPANPLTPKPGGPVGY